LLRLSYGSFAAFGSTLQTTGTADRLGYVLSLHRQGTDGEVNENVFDENTNSVQHVGSGMLGSSVLAKLRYAFGSAGAGYAELSFHDQSAFRDLSAGLTTYAPPSGFAPDLPQVDSAAGTALQTHNAGYGLDVSVPLGSSGATGVAATTVLFRHYSSIVNESVYGPGAEQTPYLFNSRDLLDDETLQLDHRIGNGALTLQYEIRNESLTTDFIPGVVNEQSIVRRTGYNPDLAAGTFLPLDDDTPDAGTGQVTLPLGQTQRSLALRYTYNPTPALHFTAGGYYSQLSLFGNYLDPRFGFVFTPDSRTSVRLSAGTTFQAPQLPELVVPNPLPAVAGNFLSIGNPNLKPDEATEYGLGLDRIVAGGANPTAVSADVYRVNLRQPAAPLVPQFQDDCVFPPVKNTPVCPFSYPVNAGDAVYQGIELSVRHNFGPDTALRAGWAVRSAYLTAVPAEIQDGTLVVGEQSAGLPLHKIAVSLTKSPLFGPTYGLNFIYEGLYNELNQPQFATLDAHLGYRFRGGYELSLTGTNLTNVYDQHFTTPNGGVVYGGQPGAGTILQDAYALQGTAFTFSVLRRF
jgi:outer membrane receptor protein involved in Fe transport